MDRSIQPKTKNIEDFSMMVPQRSVFKNGIPFSVINIGQQEVVRLDILFAGGRWRQKQKLQSVFTNRMLKEGTAQYTSAEIAEKLDYYGAWLELSSSSDFEYITLYSLNKHFDATLKIVESIVKEPLFPQKELDIVINANIQQFQINSSKVDFLSHRKLLNVLYGDNHPCGQLVEEDDYRKITSQELKAFYDEYYHSGNCSIFLSGKITDDILHSVEQRFGEDSFGTVKEREALIQFPIATATDKRFFIDSQDSSQSSIKLGCHTLTRQDPDYLKYRVMLKLFGGYFGSRLMMNIREEKGYTYGISANNLFYPFDGLMVVNTESDHKYVDSLIEEVYHEIDKMHTTLPSEEELLAVKNYMIGDMCRSYESPFSLSDAWMFIYTSGLDDEYFNRSIQAIQSITDSEIQELAKKYLNANELKEVIVGKR